MKRRWVLFSFLGFCLFVGGRRRENEDRFSRDRGRTTTTTVATTIATFYHTITTFFSSGVSAAESWSLLLAADKERGLFSSKGRKEEGEGQIGLQHNATCEE